MTETDAKPFKFQTLGIASPPAAVPPPNTFNYEENQLVESYVADPIGELFKERKNLRIDKFEYDRCGDQAGLVLIFNQENFDDQTLGTRKGSRRDVNEITVCLQRQGFNIDPNNIFTDLTTSEISDKIKEVSIMDLSDYNCLIIFFLSHGEEFNMLHTKDGTVLAEDIWQPFRLNKSLKNKPKMFILQACKGDKYSTTGTAKSPKSTEATIMVPTKTFQANSLYPDMVIFYSAIEGNFSFRNVFTGSWFIQELCKNFSAYGKRDDVISLLIRTTKCVAGNYYHKYKDEEKKEVVDRKQMPLVVSRLTKKFYLNRNKDRDTLLRIAESNEEILKNIKDIKLQFDKLLSKDEDKKKKK